MPNYVAIGSEFTVNTTYARSQVQSDAARLADGNFVVTWVDADFNTSAGRFLRAQVYAPNGTAVGGEVTLASGNSVGTEPSVAALPGGGYVVAWRPLGSIAAQMFDASGAPTSAVITVSTTGASGFGEPDVAVLANGGFAITWDDSRTSGGDVNGSGVHLRVFGPTGAPVGGDVLVNVQTSRNQADPSITALADGGYVVTWADRGASAGWVIKGQIFTAAGTRSGTEFLVNGAGTSFGSVESSVTTLANGNFAIAWYDASAHRVQVFTAAGTRVGPEVSVASNLGGTQVGPRLAALSDGGYALAWTTDGALTADGSGRAVLVQVYDADGLPNGEPMLVNSQTGGDQLDPSIVGLADGAFVVTWSDLNGTGADDDQVKAQRFGPHVDLPNAAPTIVSGGGAESFAVSLDEGQTAVTNIVATDADGPNQVQYSIAGGADADLFAIDSATGVLSFVAAPDFSAPVDADGDNVYEVIVRASDGELSDEQALAITVGNVNEAPAIVSNGGGASAALNVAEGEAQVATVAATDDDGDAVTYAIVGGADAARFTIDAATGALAFASTPDHETPGDADGDNVYQLIVRASDGTLSDTQSLSVTVGNVNEAPGIQFAGAFASDSIVSSAPEGWAEFATFGAFDPDGNVLSWSLSGEDAGLFAFDPASGQLSFKAAPDFEAPGSAQGTNSYRLILSVGDGNLGDALAITIHIRNVNETLAITSNGGGAAGAVTVEEDNGIVTTVLALDRDGDTVIYGILGGADADSFTIDPQTGALRFAIIPDFEAPDDADGDNVYEVKVSASDGAFVVSQTLTVTVANRNEGIFITSNGGGTSAAVNMSENARAVTTVIAHDPDGTQPIYSIRGGPDAALFTIDPATGVLSFVEAPDFEARADQAGANFYTVEVEASDGERTNWQKIQIRVTDVDEPVTIVSNGGGATASLSMDENGTAVTTVAASDPDPDDEVHYWIGGGADADLFDIDESTGALRFTAAPDFDAPQDADGDNVYEVVVGAGPIARPDTQTLFITVTDRDEGPAIHSYGGARIVSLTLGENGASVGQVSAADQDGDEVTYRIAGGADAALFTIDAATGALGFVDAPNFEAPRDADRDNRYHVDVVANSTSFSSSQSFTIAVANVNEPLSIKSNGGGNSAFIGVAENVRGVTTVAALDADGGPVAFSIAGGADAARFTIDPQTGVLQFVAAPDFESPADADGDNRYDVVVRASDGEFVDLQTLSVAVSNMVDGRTITGTAGHDVIDATAAGVSMRTTNAEDIVYGRDGHDTIDGQGGSDDIFGDAGKDVLIGGTGADRLTGGMGADQFVFKSAADSTPGAPDLIADFSRAQGDRILLSEIDANSSVAGNQAFAFIGTAAFSRIAGQLRYETSGGNTIVSGDINGDGLADLQIYLTGTAPLAASDFVL